MSDLLEKSFLFGLGALSMSKSAAEKFIDEAIKQCKITPEEGKTLAATMEEEGRKVRENLENTLIDIIKTRGVSILPIYKDFKALEDRVAALEAKLGVSEAEKAPQDKK